MGLDHLLSDESSTVRPVGRGFVEDIVDDESTVGLIPEFLKFLPEHCMSVKLQHKSVDIRISDSSTLA